MLVIPVYIYRNMHLHDVVIFGELLAVAVIIMCLLFVTVDLGRPDRFLHIFQRFNWPVSMLTWGRDRVVRLFVAESAHLRLFALRRVSRALAIEGVSTCRSCSLRSSGR